MSKRLLYRVLLLSFCSVSVQSLAISSAASLINVPVAMLPPIGTVEYGVESKAIVQNDDSLAANNAAFFKFSLSDRLTFSYEVDNDFDSLYSFAAQVVTFNTNAIKPLDHYLSIGFMNLGWNANVAAASTTGLTNMPTIRKYGMYSISLPGRETNYHIGLASYHGEESYRVISGIHHRFTRYLTMAEWDGRQVSFGFKYFLSDTLSLFTSVTPLPYSDDGNIENKQFVSFALSSTTDAFSRLFFDRKSVQEIREENKILHQKLAVLDAKMDVVREFSSVDFVEEFEQFLLKEHMAEKALEKESKVTIKSALDHMQKGLEFYYLGQYEMALNEYRLVTSILPDFPIAYARLGSIYYKLGDYENADKNWQKALELDPSNESLKAFLRSIKPVDVTPDMDGSNSDDMI